MSAGKSEPSLRLREPLNRVSWHMFGVLLFFCVVFAGINVGLALGMTALNWPAILIVHLIILYWILVAGALTLYVRWQIKISYEDPARRISEASRKIAQGDFSVRIEPVHPEGEEQNFFDETIADVNAMAGELGSIETLKTDFISNVSHEMKTPLAVIRNYAELLGRGMAKDDPHREYVDIITENAGKMAELVTNILRLNRIENQRIVPEKTEFDLVGQLADCVLAFERVWEEKGIEPDIELLEDCRIVSDASLLELIWNNLLSNAFKFTEPGGTVSVKLLEEPESVRVTVSDTGCGMSEETTRHIFDKFYQGDTSHATEGNGLGLALAHRVAVMLGGDISVTSVIGQGSTFTVTIPKGS